MKGFGRLISRALLNQKRFELCREINTTCRLTPCRFIHVSSAMAPFLHSRGGAFSECKKLKSSLHPEKWTLLTEEDIVYTNPVHTESIIPYVSSWEANYGCRECGFPNARSAMNSPLAKSIYEIDGITRVFFGADFVTVTKSDDASWEFLEPEIFAAIMDFYSSGEPLFQDSKTAATKDTAISEDDSETVTMIKELETGIVKLTMQGACSGCPSSSVTLEIWNREYADALCTRCAF
ncbi:nifU-like protein 4 [Populus alba x Populus x berolinensis]|nr:nifU-like protein 4 [Populus alba x Populus x berolinensis]